MNLVLYSNQALDDLEKLATANFSAVANKDLGPVAREQYPPAFTPTEMSKLYRFKTLKKTKELTVRFPLPSHQSQFRTNPLSILSWLMGHESEGSILQNLIQRGLALELYSYPLNISDYFSFFIVGITLTPKGFEEYESVIETVFEYLAMLREKGLPESIFKEIQVSNNNQFEFKNKISGMNKSIRMSEALADYPPQMVNKIGYLMENYEPENFMKTVERLDEKNFYVMLKSDEFETLQEKDGIYGFEYSQEQLRPEFIAKIGKIVNRDPEYKCKSKKQNYIKNKRCP